MAKKNGFTRVRVCIPRDSMRSMNLGLAPEGGPQARGVESEEICLNPQRIGDLAGIITRKEVQVLMLAAAKAGFRLAKDQFRRQLSAVLDS